MSDLSDAKEIEDRIRTASNQVGALSNFFRTPISTERKIEVFMAICFNTAVYGCKSWTLSKRSKQRIRSFFHTNIRKIMRINRHHVQEYNIRNKHIRNKFMLPDPIDNITKRQHQVIGNIARLTEDRIPRRFLGAWVPKRRPRGRPFLTIRDTYLETLSQTIGEEVKDNGRRLADWILLTENKKEWDKKAKDWLENKIKNEARQHGDHPLLGTTTPLRSQFRKDLGLED